MTKQFSDQQLQAIAQECNAFEHIISAMGYGYSIVNVSEFDFVRRCSDCIHWADGQCGIFAGEIRLWREKQ